MIGQATRFILGVRNSEAPLRRADAPWMIAIVAFGGILGPLFLMLGLARTSAASGSLLLNLEGLATMAIAWVVYRENADRRCSSARRRFLQARSRCPGRAKAFVSMKADC